MTTSAVRARVAPRWGGWRARALNGLVGDVRAALVRHDPLLLAAGVTFYAALAVVPLGVVSLRLVGWVGGDGAVRSFALVVAVFLPHSGADAGNALADAALRVPWPVLVASVFPASLYADGLRRALTRLSRAGVRPDCGRRCAAVCWPCPGLPWSPSRCSPSAPWVRL